MKDDPVRVEPPPPPVEWKAPAKAPVKAWDQMTYDEKAAEAGRRATLRGQGLPLHTDLSEGAMWERGHAINREREAGRWWHYKGPQQQPSSGLLEGAEQERIVKMFQLAGGVVYRLSQSRATRQSPGLGDLFVLFTTPPGCGLWWETKVEGGEISDAQKDFALNCSNAMERYGRGDTRAAGDWLVQHERAEYDAGERIGVRIMK